MKKTEVMSIVVMGIIILICFLGVRHLIEHISDSSMVQDEGGLNEN